MEARPNNSAAVVQPGEKVFVVNRRLFRGDVRRHFIGTVLAVEMPVVRTSGYVFATDPTMNQFRRRGPARARLIALAGDSLIVNILPAAVEIEKITYEYRGGTNVTVTDRPGWQLDVTHL